jgi:hypothetical protein
MDLLYDSSASVPEDKLVGVICNRHDGYPAWSDPPSPSVTRYVNLTIRSLVVYT